MRIICLVKFTPDIDSFTLDQEKQVLVRENGKQILNPDDGCALGFALRLKKKYPELEVTIVSMTPIGLKEQVADLVRRRADGAVMLSDPMFGGSDTLATAGIIGKYLKNTSYDVILTGTHTVDGDTAHVPAQLAEYLKLPYMAGIKKIDEETFLRGTPLVEVETEHELLTFEIDGPAILGIGRESGYKLPFVRFDDLDLDVEDKIQIIDHEALEMQEEEIGILGSATRVVKTYPAVFEKRTENFRVKVDPEGIDKVYEFLKREGYLK